MILNIFSLGIDRIQKVARSLTLKDHVIVTFLLLSLVINLVLWFYLAYFLRPSDIPVPLHFTVYFGIDYIDLWYKIFSLPLFGILILLMNFSLIYLLYLKERILSYLLVVNTLLVHLLLFTAGYLIVRLNI